MMNSSNTSNNNMVAKFLNFKPSFLSLNKKSPSSSPKLQSTTSEIKLKPTEFLPKLELVPLLQLTLLFLLDLPVLTLHKSTFSTL